jgi:RNA polymerase sigma factor (TIGR02999 family)
MGLMTEVTRILDALEQGDPGAAEQLLPLVDDELRRLAAQRLAQEAPGQTLQATALVHEAYLRLVNADQTRPWNSRGHCFAAAAEAMRRILVENARCKNYREHGDERTRLLDCDPARLAAPEVPNDLLAHDEGLSRLAAADPQAAEVVQLRYFGGLTLKQAAELLGVSPRTADSWWAYARSWLLAELRGDGVRPRGDVVSKHVRVHGPRVTAVQLRARCGSRKADRAAIGPEATSDGASGCRTDVR